MKYFLIIANENKDPGMVMANGITRYIASNGGVCRLMASTAIDLSAKIQGKKIKELADRVCAIVLGGDGTLVRAAAAFAGTGIPIIGVNLGTLGYLCELERDTVLSAVDRIMEDRFSIEDRMMLSGSKSGEEKAHQALNDIVIHRAGKTQIIRLSVTVNGKFLYEYDADGIIVAAPTGSTGYNLSVGGPIVDPKADMMLITPISPHGLNARSIVIGADADVSISIIPRRPEIDEGADVAFDGDLCAQLCVGDEIRIARAEKSVRVLKLTDSSFLQILSKKMKGYR